MTPIEVYNTIYTTLKTRLLTLNPTISKDKASRLSNKFAVKHTWEFYNNSYLLNEFTQGVEHDSSKTN